MAHDRYPIVQEFGGRLDVEALHLVRGEPHDLVGHGGVRREVGVEDDLGLAARDDDAADGRPLLRDQHVGGRGRGGGDEQRGEGGAAEGGGRAHGSDGTTAAPRAHARRARRARPMTRAAAGAA